MRQRAGHVGAVDEDQGWSVLWILTSPTVTEPSFDIRARLLAQDGDCGHTGCPVQLGQGHLRVIGHLAFAGGPA